MSAVKYVSSVVLAAVIVITAAVNCGSNEHLALENFSYEDFAGQPESVTIQYYSQTEESGDTALSRQEAESDAGNTSSSRNSTTTDTYSTTASTTSATSTTTAAAEQAETYGVSDYINDIVTLVNVERAAVGRSTLTVNAKLTSAAQKRAQELANLQTLRPGGESHVRADGSPWYTVLGVKEGENYNYGENLASGNFAASKFVSMWMNSSGHRQNIVSKEYTETGVGCAKSDDGLYYCVQIFYRP